MNINRGNQFVRLVSMGSQSRGLNLFAAKAFGPDSPQAKTALRPERRGHHAHPDGRGPNHRR